MFPFVYAEYRHYNNIIPYKYNVKPIEKSSKSDFDTRKLNEQRKQQNLDTKNTHASWWA